MALSAMDLARLRWAGFVVCGAGLAVFYLGNIVQAASGDAFDVPAEVWRGGVAVAAVGCLMILAPLVRPATRPARAVWDARFGFFCLPAAVLSLFGALGDGDSGTQPFWLVITVLLLPASVLVIMLSAGVEREAKHGRDRPGGAA